MDVITARKEVFIMEKTKTQEAIEEIERQKIMDATVKSAFDAIVKWVSRKMEHKKPKDSDPSYVHIAYGDLERSFKVLNKITKNPARYFINDYEDKVLGDLLEVSRITGARFNRLLDSLMSLSIIYYRGKDVDKNKLETEIKKLNKTIQLKAATGFVRTFGMLLTPAEKFVAEAKEK